MNKSSKKIEFDYQVQYSLPLIERYIQRLSPLIRQMAAETKKLMFNSVAFDAKWGMPLIRKTAFLRKRWYTKFRQASKDVYRDIIKTSQWQAEYTLQQQLQSLKASTEQQELSDAQIRSEIITNNVKLIRSIPQVYLKSVQRAVKKAKNKTELTEKLMNINNTTYKRARMIASDQVEKAQGMYALYTAQKNGATMGRWIHVAGQYSSRPTHVAMNGQLFDLRVGMFDPDVGRCVFPKELWCCRCKFSAVMVGELL